MKWNNLKLSRKFLFAFGIIISLLTTCGLWAIFGINGIVGNASEAIDGNKLRSDLEGKYVDHLIWAKELNKLLSDDSVTKLNVQTDHKQCAFGQWYYGEGRKEALRLAPELKPILDEFEEPHMHLHHSAIEIADVFKQVDWHISIQLKQAQLDHILWMNNVKDAIFIKNAKHIDVTKDPEQCNFGKWLHSEALNKLITNNPELKQSVEQIVRDHNKLHQSIHYAESLQKKGDNAGARKYFNSTIKKNTELVLNELGSFADWSARNQEGMDDAKHIYHNETIKYLETMGKLFDKTIEESKKYVLTDEVMLSKAKNTQFVVLLIIIGAIIIAILMAYFITGNLVTPIKKSLKFANTVAKGDLTATVEIDQKDEIGQLADALVNMSSQLQEIVTNIKTGSDNLAVASQQLTVGAQQISSGVSEQAASAEEISSSMEEMTANIHQNASNAKQAQEISDKSSKSIQEMANASERNVKASANINGKIQIIVEIAQQTNILALNAAVEAARAGEYGRGFTVVATEIRKLAERSKEAAKDIVQLCKEGSLISENSHKLLQEIIPDINNTSMLVEEIASASIEQEQGVNQVNSAIHQFSSVTQQNATSAEEMASSSEELSGQAGELDRMMHFFKVNNSENHQQEKRQQISSAESTADAVEKNGITFKPNDQLKESEYISM